MLIIFDLDDTLYDCHTTFPEGKDEAKINTIKPYPGVKEILQRQDRIKILVTKGEESWQRRKLAILELTPYFNEIIICATEQEKKDAFHTVRQKFPQEKIIIVGDRIDAEIRYGNELCFITILLRRGKYKQLKAQEEMEMPTYQITDFTQLRQVLELL